MANRSLISRILSGVSRFAFHVARHQHFTLILLVFLTFRLMLPFVFRSGSYFVEQAPDLGDYLRWGTLADSGLYPYVDYWSEYPPLFPWSMIGLYRVSTLLPSWPFDQRLWFALVTQLVMAMFDLGSLILVYAMARMLGSRARALRTAALFGGAFITAYAASSWYEPVPLFFLLLALYLILRDRYAWSALAAGVGVMAKLFPIVVVPIAIRRITRTRHLAGYLAALAATLAAISLPFWVPRPDFVLAFVRSTLNRPAWLSIWAVFDGSYLYGVAVPTIDRFTADAVGLPPDSQLPWPLIHLLFLGLFLFLYTRRVNWREPTKSVAFAGLTINLFLLWSKGFSGQFIAYAFPFIVLLMPNLRGALYAGLLSAIWVAEWPIAFQMMEGQNWFIVWIVMTRSAILIVLSLEYFARLSVTPRVSRFAPRIGIAVLAVGWLSLAPVGVISANVYAQARIAADRAAPALDTIHARHDDRSQVIAFAQPRLFRRLYSAARFVGWPTLLPIFRHTPEAARLSWLNEITARGAFWFIADEGDPETLAENRRAEAWLSEHACKVETQIAGSARVSRFVGMDGAPAAVDVSAVFADEIELAGYRFSAGRVRAGGALCVELIWQALRAPSADYTVFVHIVDAQGRLVAQNDQPPRGSFAPTSGWAAESTVTDKHGIILPPNLPGGDYRVQVGLYRTDDLSPVRVTRGEDTLPDALRIALASLSVAP